MSNDGRKPADCDELDFRPERIRFPEVIGDEYAELQTRRGNPGSRERPAKIVGLALSGGGVRSATFNLGLLQALASAGKLGSFDYLSTVSGGGYVGGWWSAWLSREERTKKDGLFPPHEAIDSVRDAERSRMETEGRTGGGDQAQVKDSALTAAKDPIHHLRLFSNVMTPRKGLLSADTWRAIAVISRNIVLTWMILLPMMLAAIMIGQAWFALAPETEEGFRYRHDAGGYYASNPRAMDPEPSLRPNLTQRFIFALYIPALLFIGSVVAVTLWMLFSRRWQSWGDWLVNGASAIAFLLLTFYLFRVLQITVDRAFKVSFVAWLIVVAFWMVVWARRHKAKLADRDFLRNRAVVLQTRTLQYSVFTAVIFLFAAFGYEVVDFLLFNQSLHSGVADVVAKAGGWAAILLTAVSTIYTVLKSSPTGGGDTSKGTAPPSKLRQLLFAIAPPLLLLLLGVTLAWVGHRLYTEVYEDGRLVLFAARGAIASAFLFLIFALYELRPPQRLWKSLVVVAIWLVVVITAFFVQPEKIQEYVILIGVGTLLVLAAALLWRSYLRRAAWIAGYALALVLAAYWLYRFTSISKYIFTEDPRVLQLVVAGLVGTLALLAFELWQGRGANTRSITLTVIACTLFVALAAAICAGPYIGWRATTIVGLITTILGWVLALGWLADPNLLTMHGFYKARLVRAYMGASNVARGKAKDADITDAVPGDDLPLTELKNTERGAPYHLINTMLNLVGGSDLSTQARSSDSFLMSKLYCGSVRTGFRRTEEYACGSISLGTAVSVSGAAASPTMGAQTPSAALSALMTLFNIRTGYWAPTPSLAYWRSGSARLWPVYTVQELTASTTDLLPYCYLTDGGHYENTGVYSLIQRGCRVIVVGECGQDPQTTMDDIGNLIRKVRIDFRTEIYLDISQLRAKPPGVHVIVGKIKYGQKHAEELGLESRDGVIVIVKPNLAGEEPVDVQQYGFLNKEFPQQGTFDLWYDEAQFESYRRLGQLSGELAVATGQIP